MYQRHSYPIYSAPETARPYMEQSHQDYLIAACIANVCILIRSCCLIFCFSPGDRVSLVLLFPVVMLSSVGDLLLIVEYVGIEVFFCSSLDQDDVDEVVLIEDVSDEALEVLVKREKGLEGIVVSFVGGCGW
jgi:nitroreductase